jgi:hypothetical protein
MPSQNQFQKTLRQDFFVKKEVKLFFSKEILNQFRIRFRQRRRTQKLIQKPVFIQE